MAVSISGDREDGSAQFGSGGGDEDGIKILVLATCATLLAPGSIGFVFVFPKMPKEKTQ